MASLSRSADLPTPELWMNVKPDMMHLVNHVFRKADTIRKLELDGAKEDIGSML
jgi:hypothetical protein